MAKKRLSIVEHVFTARFPGDIWHKLVESAEKKGNSINAELMDILRERFGLHVNRPAKKPK